MSGPTAPPGATGRREVRVRVPVRIDFAGGWSDVHYFSAREGGAALSGAIDLFVDGRAWSDGQRMEVRYGSDIPAGSGLGASAALDVARIALTAAQMGRRPTSIELAESAYRLEKVLGVEGGKQDQYASAIGGFNHLRFGAEDQAADVEHLEPEAHIVAELEERLVLCYTGSAHVSGDLHARVWASYARGDEAMLSPLRGIRDSVRPARDALVRGDLETLGEMMTLNREHVRRLAADLVTPQMDQLFAAAADAGAPWSKPCGAGGGGCLAFLCRPGARGAVVASLESTGVRVIPVRFAPRSEW